MTDTTAASQDRNPFMRLLGASQIAAPPGQVRISLLTMRPELLNQLSAAHGGVVATLLDSALSRTASATPGGPAHWGAPQDFLRLWKNRLM